MTTNDPQAPYGEEIPEHWWRVPFVPPKPSRSGRIYHEDFQFLKMDKPTERAPILSDDEIDAIVREGARHTQLYDGMELERWKGGARWALRYVLNAKIISGELRVVKKVELWHPSVPEDVWREWLTGSDAEFSMLVTKCCSKNPWCPPWGHGKGVWDDKDYTVKYPRLLYVCPGCGAEIQK
jgi:hypothetical protein